MAQFYHTNPRTWQVQASRQVQISRTSLQRIMKDLRMRLWRPRLVHVLNEDDFDRRSHLNRQVNRHNSVYYAEGNPHLLMEGERVQSPGVCVWAAI